MEVNRDIVRITRIKENRISNALKETIELLGIHAVIKWKSIHTETEPVVNNPNVKTNPEVVSWTSIDQTWGVNVLQQPAV